MSFWNAIVLVMAIIAFMEVRKAKYHAQIGMYEDKETKQLVSAPQGTSPREAELERELAVLRARLEVLERIATDANSSAGRHASDIAREIESLRG